MFTANLSLFVPSKFSKFTNLHKKELPIMQNESSTKQNETTSRDTFILYLLAFVVGAVLFNGGYYLATAMIAKMMTE